MNALAYLDPGSGGLMLQALVAGVASAAVMGKVYWRRAKRFLGFRREETPRRVGTTGRTSRGSAALSPGASEAGARAQSPLIMAAEPRARPSTSA